MTTATTPVLAVAELTEHLASLEYRVTISRPDVFVAERPILGVRHALRRVVGQRNHEESWRIGYLFARPRGDGPSFEHDLVARHPACRDLATFAVWIATQDARAFPPPAVV